MGLYKSVYYYYYYYYYFLKTFLIPQVVKIISRGALPLPPAGAGAGSLASGVHAFTIVAAVCILEIIDNFRIYNVIANCSLAASSCE